MEIKIDKGIPYTSNRRRYPWDKMEIGDSFFVPTEDQADEQAMIRSAGSQWLKRNGVSGRIATKQVTENGKKGVRVWRIEKT